MWSANGKEIAVSLMQVLCKEVRRCSNPSADF
jgi:hypothetical protein